MIKYAWLPTILLAAGCTRVEYIEYRGVQGWPRGSAFVQSIDGIEVFEGLPQREYEVLGLIDVYAEGPFYHDNSTRDRVIKMTKERGGSALLWLSERSVRSGGFSIGGQNASSGVLDSGSSSQPEILVATVQQNTSMSYKKSLRSTLLVVKWK